MSTHFGGRTLARSQALQLLFQAEANARPVLAVLDGDYALSEGPLDDYARRLAAGVDESRPELDAVISDRSTSWSITRMNGVDRNLLRIALYEMLHVDEVAIAVSIDECVELAKAYGTDESARFVNGLLGRVADDLEAGVDVVERAHERRAAAEAAAAEAAEAVEADADAQDAGDAPAPTGGELAVEPADPAGDEGAVEPAEGEGAEA
ncbi:transcription antitermination factor NusB [Olsenella sp. An290]|uniref:transcription antitermination factor NusB n=1 Tax=Olsenella sp. An290 TaxID=1965625 RepID=UPI000B370E38|nr:transcription antitermination factor NusB [Olsenella sp. An290]OUO34636.1 transcription antitermination factor NusB [Olsenella sp. An290]